MLKITNWPGRSGNNILQILYLLKYSIDNGYSCSSINHPLFNFFYNVDPCSNKKIDKNFLRIINIDPGKYYKFNKIKSFQLKQIFKKYVNTSFVYQKEKKYDICFHIRGGDIMKNINRTHSTYVQPPFSFYQKIIEENKGKKICVVYEDTHNPVVKPLMEKYNWVNFQSSSIQKDLETLACCETLIGSMGTFWLISFFMSECVKKVLYYENMPWLDTSDWGVESEKISFPNYIKVGEWKNSPEQRKLMLEYKY